MAIPGEKYLAFRCTGCGNCCKEPLLPLTPDDLARIVAHTGESPLDVVKFVDKDAIQMDDEPQAFVMLRQGKRVMVLKHRGGRCIYLGSDDRCTIYAERPEGCRIFPFDPAFTRKGKLRRLKLIQATECPYELDAQNDVDQLRQLHERSENQRQRHYQQIAEWNRVQRRRKRQGKQAQGTRELLAFFGVPVPRPRAGRRAPV